MIETDLTKFLPDLLEVENLFKEYGTIDIRHKFTDGGTKIVNTVIVNGKAYAYGSYIGDRDEITRKRLIKRYAKLSVYRTLSHVYGVSLAWGSLTGIRPTKLAYQEIAESGDGRQRFFRVHTVLSFAVRILFLYIERRSRRGKTDGRIRSRFNSRDKRECKAR